MGVYVTEYNLDSDDLQIGESSTTTAPTVAPTKAPTKAPTTKAPTKAPTTSAPTTAPCSTTKAETTAIPAGGCKCGLEQSCAHFKFCYKYNDNDGEPNCAAAWFDCAADYTGLTEILRDSCMCNSTECLKHKFCYEGACQQRKRCQTSDTSVNEASGTGSTACKCGLTEECRASQYCFKLSPDDTAPVCSQYVKCSESTTAKVAIHSKCNCGGSECESSQLLDKWCYKSPSTAEKPSCLGVAGPVSD